MCPGYTIEQGRLLYKASLVISKDSFFTKSLLHKYHDSAFGGHNDELKTYLRLASDWDWVEMRAQVTKYVRESLICQRNKTFGFLTPLPISSDVQDGITIDFVEALAKSKGFDTVLDVMDH